MIHSKTWAHLKLEISVQTQPIFWHLFVSANVSTKILTKADVVSACE